MYPHERSLVEKLKDEPFAIIGVNSDEDLEELAEAVEKENITWRSFWNGPLGTAGPISTKCNVQGWPTMYLIDAKSVIRHHWLGSPGNDVLDKAIDELLIEAEQAK